MSLRNIFILSFVLFCLCNIGVFSIDSYIKTEVTPLGIISFEFIQTTARAGQALTAWGTRGQMAVGLSIGLDYLYILLYLIMGFAGFRLITQKLAVYSRRMAASVRWLSALCPLTGLFDLTENYSLIRILTGSQDAFWPGLAHLCALGKFTGSILCIALALMSVLYMVAFFMLRAAKS
ncbi:hypothetical protein [Vibrio quintilis]|uniref:Uncharacterized protein n=1 Tax=Vibrio quintilis TaxID=1117707 RepID=A0A1M7YWB2_9VIBR|nr:hypothetical protein [Vibrio quintilis]SHO56878.1 hypothetical protein VQ7734_02647 [Vibrio quintilis]